MEGKRRAARLWAVLAVCMMLLLDGCAFQDATDVVVREDSTKKSLKEGASSGIKYTIYLITMNQASNYWQMIDAGCKKAVKEIGGIDYRWRAPPKTDIAEQRECIDEAVEAHANAILISAASETELNDSLAAAVAAGVKLIYVDSTATQEAIATLATDNVAAGRTAARTMQRALAAAGITEGTIGLAAGGSGQATNQRDKGFREGFSGTAFRVAPTFNMDGDQQNIKRAVREHPDYVAFFGANEQTTWALSSQAYESGIHPIIVGFDTSDRTLDMMQKGVIYATLQQKPQQMGYDGIRIAVEALEGKYTRADAVTDMGITVITRDKI